MAWVRISDDFYDHPKFIEAGPLGLSLWIAALGYCNRNLTDGFIAESVARRLVDFDGLAYEVSRAELCGVVEDDCAPLAVELLISANLWHRSGHDCDTCEQPKRGHLVFHDYLDFQPSAEQIRQTKDGRSEAGKRGAAARWNGKSHSKGHGKSHGKTDGKTMPPTPTPTQEESNDSSSPLREDVDRLCKHLADKIADNGSKRPNITKAWRDSARLLIDKDGRTEDQIHRCIDWCQADDFWKSNILSMPKLREKYDQLRLRAGQDRPAQIAPTGMDDMFANLGRVQSQIGGRA